MYEELGRDEKCIKLTNCWIGVKQQSLTHKWYDYFKDLTVMEYLCHIWPRICSTFHKHFRSYPHPWLITGFVTRWRWRVPPVEQTLLTVSEHLGSSPFFSRVRGTRSVVLYVCFIYRCLSFCTFSFDPFNFNYYTESMLSTDRQQLQL